jgi:hypothetical protein
MAIYVPLGLARDAVLIFYVFRCILKKYKQLFHAGGINENDDCQNG